MMLKPQKRLAGRIMKCSTKRVHFNPELLEEIKEAITTADIKALIGRGVISKRQKHGISKARARDRKLQRRKGRQKGQGTRKGRATSRLQDKRRWINKVRLQRRLLKALKSGKRITPENYKTLYRKSKGGFFRSKKHLKLYAEEHDMLTQQAKERKEKAK